MGNAILWIRDRKALPCQAQRVSPHSGLRPLAAGWIPRDLPLEASERPPGRPPEGFLAVLPPFEPELDRAAVDQRDFVPGKCGCPARDAVVDPQGARASVVELGGLE